VDVVQLKSHSESSGGSGVEAGVGVGMGSTLIYPEERNYLDKLL